MLWGSSIACKYTLCAINCWAAPPHTPWRARSSVMESLANRPFMPPMGHTARVTSGAALIYHNCNPGAAGLIKAG